MKESIPFLRLTNKRKNQNPLVEIVYIALAVLSVFLWEDLNKFGNIILLAIWIVALAILMSLAINNSKTLLLPNKLILPLLVIAVIYQIVQSFVMSDIALIGQALLGGLVLGGVPYILFQLSSGRFIGGGDVKLGFVAGILLGFKFSLICLGITSLLFGLIFLFAYLVSKVTETKIKPRIGTGEVWVIATVVSFLFGNELLKLL